MDGVYSHNVEVNSMRKYGIPARGLGDIHSQSTAARFGLLRIVLGTAVPLRDCGTFRPGANYI